MRHAPGTILYNPADRCPDGTFRLYRLTGYGLRRGDTGGRALLTPCDGQGRALAGPMAGCSTAGMAVYRQPGTST